MSNFVGIKPPCGCFDDDVVAPVMVHRRDLHDEYRWFECDRCGVAFAVRMIERPGAGVVPEIHVRSRRSA